MIGCGRFFVIGSRGDTRARIPSPRTLHVAIHGGVFVTFVVAAEQASSERVVAAGQGSSAGEAAPEIAERLPALLPGNTPGKRADQSRGDPLE